MSSAIQNEFQPTPIRKGSYTALDIVYIIDNILLKLVEDTQVKKADLVSMARCCKAFEDPSLNRLWASMSSVVPLLRLIHGVDEYQGSLIIAGKITLEELSPRFHSYAKRIRHVCYDVRGDFDQVDPSTWIRLAHIAGAPLPNLRSFKLSYSNPSTLGRERSLLLLPALIRTGSISSFAFRMPSVGHHDRHEVGPILTLLSDYDWGLEALVASGTFLGRYAEILATMQTLRSVSLELSYDSVLPNILMALASLPRLTELSLEFFGETPDPSCMKSNLFPKLVGIVLKGKITFISRTLASMKASCLECVDITVMDGARDGTQESLLLSLQLSHFPGVRRILVDLKGCDSSLRHGERDNKVSFVAQILGNRNVEELIMTSLEPSMCLSDYEILDLAAAWPLLKILRLEHTASPAMQPSFASLEILARQCPHLTELSITLREDYRYPILDAMLTPVPPLEGLNLQHTKLKGYARAVRYLGNLFPDLHKLSISERRAFVAIQEILCEDTQLLRKVERIHMEKDDEENYNGGKKTKEGDIYFGSSSNPFRKGEKKGKRGKRS